MPLDNKKKEEIKKEAKKLLDKFSKSLESVKSSESNVVRDSDRREEGQGHKGKEKFRDIMFENAPSTNKDFLVAEKKTW